MWGARCGAGSRIPGSHPEPKADPQLLSHPGVPRNCLFILWPRIEYGRVATGRAPEALWGWRLNKGDCLPGA